MNRGVEIRDLRKEFALVRWQGLRRRLSQVTAVDGITLDVPAGQSVAFIGPNGAGKSTTIKILTGILHPSSGQVKVLGLTPWVERRKLAQHIGAVFGQRSQLWYHLPPADTFELIARIYSLERDAYRQTRDALVDRFALGPFMDTPVRKLSLGQRMRAEVAASLLHRPKVLFLDEPTIGLDAVARQELRDLVREWNLREGATIFLTSHDAGDIEHVADARGRDQSRPCHRRWPGGGSASAVCEYEDRPRPIPRAASACRCARRGDEKPVCLRVGDGD